MTVAATGRRARWRSLAHPTTVAALGVLVVNDGVLKAAWHDSLTGKLSDVTGLFVFALLLAELASLVTDRRRAGVLGFAIAATSLVAVKTSAAAAGAVASALSALVGPSRIVVDPTDLLALVALVPAWRLWQRAPDRTGTTARLAGMAMAGLSIMGTAGSAEGPFAVTHVDADGGVLFAEQYRSDDGGVTFEPPPPASGQRPDAGSPTSSTSSSTSTTTTTEAPQPRSTGPDPGAQCSRATGECFRIADEMHIERRAAPGGPWVEDYTLSEGRIDYVGRVQMLRGVDSYTINEAHDLVVADRAGHAVVMVATGEEGVAVRAASGEWHRRAVGSARPKPLTGEDRVVAADLIPRWLGFLAVVVLVWMTRAAWRSPPPRVTTRGRTVRRSPRAALVVLGVFPLGFVWVLWYLFFPAGLPLVGSVVVELALVAGALTWASVARREAWRRTGPGVIAGLSVVAVVTVLEVLWVHGVIWSRSSYYGGALVTVVLAVTAARRHLRRRSSAAIAVA